MEKNSDIAERIVVCLYNLDAEERYHNVDFNNLHAQVQKLVRTSVSMKEFKDALRYLVGKKYINEEAASYSLTSHGIDYAHSVLHPPVNYDAVSIQQQRQGNRIGFVNASIAIIGVAVTVLAAWDLIGPLQSSIEPTAIATTALASGQPTVSVKATPEPSEFVVSYFSAQGRGEADVAWSMISPEAKDRNDPTLNEDERFEKFRTRILGYKTVTTQNAQTIPGDPVTVKVVVTYYYYDKDPMSLFATLTLVQDESTHWLIDTVSSTPWP